MILDLPTIVILVYTFIGGVIGTLFQKWDQEESLAANVKSDFTVIDFITLCIFWMPLMIFAIIAKGMKK